MTSSSGDDGLGEKGGHREFTIEEVRAKLEELHGQGVLDLDAPARQLIDVADARLRESFAREEGDPGEAEAYWLVGSKGWFSHVQEEMR